MSKSVLTCHYCSKEFERSNSEINRAISRGNKLFFCSRKCGIEYKRNQVVYHDFTCLNCESTFQKTDREVKNAKRNGFQIKFCSSKCKANHWGRNRKEVKCKTCKTSFLRQEKDIHNQNFCSHKCYDVYLQSLRIKTNCIHCNAKFDVLKSDLENSHKTGSIKIRTCSDKCYEEYRENFYETISCKACGVAFKKLKSQKNKIFCSYSCKEAYWAENHRVVTNCDYCKEEITIKRSRFEATEKHFCDNDCWNAFRAHLKETYGELAHYLRSTREYAYWRTAVFERANYTCEECNSTNDRLHAHHITHLFDIADKYEFDTNSIICSDDFNDINNGLCLCADCHKLKHPGLERNSDGTFCRREAKVAR